MTGYIKITAANTKKGHLGISCDTELMDVSDIDKLAILSVLCKSINISKSMIVMYLLEGEQAFWSTATAVDKSELAKQMQKLKEDE